MKKLTIALFVASILMFAASAIAATKSFSDVSTDDWFYKDVMNMVDWNVIQGHPDGTFKPGDNVNRAELSAMWNRYDNRVKQMQVPNALLRSADYAFIAGNTTILNEISSIMNDLNGTELTSSCDLISTMKDAGKLQLDIVIKLIPPSDNTIIEELKGQKTNFIFNMDNLQDLCDSVWDIEINEN